MEIRFVDVKAGKCHVRRLPCVVGRGEDADFRIKNDSVSRRHCRFALQDGVVHVTDLGSTNGTAVDRKTLAADASAAVSTGALVRLGGIVLRVEYGVAKSAAPAVRADDTVPLDESEVRKLAAAAHAPIGQQSGQAALAPAESGIVPARAFPAPAPAADFSTLDGAETAPQPADGSFDFLGGAAAEGTAADDKLDDFFKKLS